MKIASFLAAIALGVLVPAFAAGSPTSVDRATARALGLEAEAALAGKDYALAADRYARAEALFHAPTLLLGLARAQVGLGKLVDAQETYRRILSEGVASNAPPAFTEAVVSAAKELAAVEPRIAWVTIAVTGAASATVRLDNTVLPAAALGIRRPVDPGTHAIVAQGERGLVKTASVTLADGKAEKVTLDLALPEAAPPPSPVAAPVRTPPPVPGTQPVPERSRVPVYVLFGIGGASAIVASVFTGMAASSYSSFNAHPHGDTADANLAVRNARIADATWASAGVVGAAGLVVLLVTKKPVSAKAPPDVPASGRLFVTPRMGAKVGGFSAGFQF